MIILSSSDIAAASSEFLIYTNFLILVVYKNKIKEWKPIIPLLEGRLRVYKQNFPASAIYLFFYDLWGNAGTQNMINEW